jgi:hypothetical protein
LCCVPDAWESRPHKDSGKKGVFDTALYVTEPPPGQYGRASSRKFNLFDKSEFEVAEQESIFRPGYGGECRTAKDQYENTQHTGGVLLAVSFCGVVYQSRELYRSEGKQQVALFLFGKQSDIL